MESAKLGQSVGAQSRLRREDYSHKLTDEQWDRWHLAAAQVMSDPRLGQYGPLTGQQLYTSISSVRSQVDLPETLEVPVRPSFSGNRVGELVILNSGDGVRLLLRVSGELDEEVMVFGQAPCSTGRRKRRNVAYLGLLPPPVDGWSDITSLDTARYGEPRPGTKVFIVTYQQKDGWKGLDGETSANVPERPKGEQTTPRATASQFPASLTGENSQNLLMYKGSTRGAEGTQPRPSGLFAEDEPPENPGRKAAGAPSGWQEADEGGG